jgi:hypothetical protein
VKHRAKRIPVASTTRAELRRELTTRFWGRPG